MLVEKLCREEEVGFVGHLSGKGAAVFADGLTAAVDSGMGSITIFLVVNTIETRSTGGYLEVPQTGQEATNTVKPITKCPKNMSETGHWCVCLSARNIVNKN